MEQYRDYLGSSLTPSDYQEVTQAVEKFFQALNDDVTTAAECPEPLRVISHLTNTAALGERQADYEKGLADELRKLGTGLYITYTLWECYGAPTELAKDGRFEKIDENGCLKTLKDAHQALHDGKPFQAWPNIYEFREKAGLPAIEFLGKK